MPSMEETPKLPVYPSPKGEKPKLPLPPYPSPKVDPSPSKGRYVLAILVIGAGLGGWGRFSSFLGVAWNGSPKTSRQDWESQVDGLAGFQLFGPLCRLGATSEPVSDSASFAAGCFLRLMALRKEEKAKIAINAPIKSLTVVTSPVSGGA